jgi:hypothetical protein
MQISNEGNNTFVQSDEDMIAKWFHQGFGLVLEKIFTNLSLTSILQCKKVSKDWQRIVLHINQQSRIPRLVKLQDVQIHKEWLRAKPRVHCAPINGLSLRVIDFIADEKHIVLAFEGPKKDIKKSKIMILDSVNMTQIHNLNVEERITALDIVDSSQDASMRLELNEKYLVAAFMFVSTYVIFIWNRDLSYSENPLALKLKSILARRLNPFNWKLQRSQFLKPIIFNDFVYLPLWYNANQLTHEIVYSCWDMSDGTFKDLLRKEFRVKYPRNNF